MTRTGQANTREHSLAWLEMYGRSLTGDEIRLVQAFRRLSPTQQQDMLEALSAEHRTSAPADARPASNERADAAGD